MPNTRVRKSGSFAASSSLLTPTFTFQFQPPPARVPRPMCPLQPCPQRASLPFSSARLQRQWLLPAKQTATHTLQAAPSFSCCSSLQGSASMRGIPLCLPCSKMSTQLPASLAPTRCWQHGPRLSPGPKGNEREQNKQKNAAVRAVSCLPQPAKMSWGAPGESWGCEHPQSCAG